MARARFQHVVQDTDGDVQSGAEVTVYETDGSTLLAQTMYDAASGGNVLTNPLTTNSRGLVTAYAAEAQYVVASVGGVAHPSAFEPDPAAVRLAGAGDIVNADISASAAIAVSKLAAGGTANRVVRTTDGATMAMGQVATDDIADLAVTNAKVSTSAGIALSKLAAGSSGVLKSDGSAITAGNTISNGDVASAAAIVVSKLSAGGTANRVVGTTDGTTMTLGQVQTGQIADDAVTAAKILDGAAMVQLSKSTLGSTQAAITFSSIPSSYSALRIEILGRSATASYEVICSMRLGTGGSLDSGTNYGWGERITYGGSATVTGAEGTADSSARIGRIVGTSGTNAADAGCLSIELPGYASTTLRRVYTAQSSYTGTTSTGGTGLSRCGGIWRNTGAVNVIELYAGATGWAAGTVAILWGIP